MAAEENKVGGESTPGLKEMFTDFPPANFTAPFEVEQMVFQMIFFILIVACNLTVLIGLGLKVHRGTKLSSMQFLIFNLAFCDLLVGFMDVLIDVIHILIEKRFYGNDAGCKILQFSESASMYSSTYMIVALSLDRLDAIMRPMHFLGREFRAKILAVIAWVLSLTFASPLLYFSHVMIKPELSNVPDCRIDFKTGTQWRIYITVLACLVFIIPAIIISTSCSVILRKIWKNKSNKSGLLGAKASQTPQTPACPQSTKVLTCNGLLSPPTCEDGPGLCPASPTTDNNKTVSINGLQKKRGLSERIKNATMKALRLEPTNIFSRAKLRSLRITFLIVIVFIFCWSPYFTFHLLDVYGYIPDRQGPTMMSVGVFIESLAPLNSLANPIIYGIFTARVCRRSASQRKSNAVLQASNTFTRREDPAVVPSGHRETKDI